MRDPTWVVDGADVFELALALEIATEPRREPPERCATRDRLGGGVAERARDVLLHGLREARRVR